MPFILARVRAAVPGLHLLSDQELAARIAQILDDLTSAGIEPDFDRVCEELREAVEMRGRLMAV